MNLEQLDMEDVVAELQRLQVERDYALAELQNAASRRLDVQNPMPLEDKNSDAENLKQMESKLSEKEALIEKMNKELNSLKEEVDKSKESEKNLSDSNENQRLEILNLKDGVKRLENELRLQKDRTATDEVVKLRNELRLAMEAEENSKQALDELALVIREVAAEANQAKEKLASAEAQVQILREQIDQLKAEAEESLLAWDEKEMEFVKCLKEEEDEKAKLQEENRKLSGLLNGLERDSKKLIEDTEKLRDAFKESFDEAEMAKTESLQLKDCLMENEKRLAVFRQENERLRAVNEEKSKRSWLVPYGEGKDSLMENEKRSVPSSTRKELKSHDVEETKSHGVAEEQKKLARSSPKKEMKPDGGGGEEELKKLARSSSKKESKSHGGAEEKEQKKSPVSSSKKETKSTTGAEEKEQKKASIISSKKETKSTTGVEEKEQKKVLVISSKKEPKASHGGEEKEHKKIKKDSSLDKELKGGNSHAKTSGLMCFDPMMMLPIPGISKHKEAGDSNDGNDDNLTDSIFDIIEPSQPQLNHSHHHHHHHHHRRTTSSLEDEKVLGVEEFEHEKKPHLDDMEVERAGAHSNKKGALLRKFGDLWRRRNQGHSQRHHNNQIHSLNQKEVTT